MILSNIFKSSASLPLSFFANFVSLGKKALSIELWHHRLGHTSYGVIEKALNSCNLSYAMKENLALCPSYSLVKSHKIPFIMFDTTYNSPLELIHTYLWGHSSVKSSNGFSYYINFIDHYTWLYLLKIKSEVHNVFIHFKNLVENQLNAKIKTIQSDWGGEYRSLTKFFQDHGIVHRISCPYTPQQHGVVERKHIHVVEMGLSLLAHLHLPLKH